MHMTRRLSLIPLVALSSIPSAYGQSASQIYVGTGQTITGAVTSSPVGTSACANCTPLPVEISSSITGLAPAVSGGAVTGLVMKASAGTFLNAYITTGSVSGTLQIFNGTSIIANAATTIGTASGQLQDCIVAPANASTAINYTGPGETFSTGVVAMFSSTGCGSLTGATLSASSAMLHGTAQ